MRKFRVTMILLATLMFLGRASAFAEDLDPYLHQKAADYTDWLIRWHSTGLGGVSDVLFTDETRTEILRTWGAGDSGDWTGTYLVAQAIRYVITGEQEARSEVLRIADYLHVLREITGDPGYLARYAAPDEPPWNVEYQGSDNKHPGGGEYEGCFWIGENVRDKYITWFWGLSWAYEAVDDPQMRATIRQDFRGMITTLQANDWMIIDPWGRMHAAARIMADIRLSILVQAARVLDEPEFRRLLDEQYERVEDGLWLSTFAFFNRYSEYYAFINNYSNMQPLFRHWPDRERLEHIFNVWKINVRQWSGDGHNPFFDAVYYQACLRLDACPQYELTLIEADAYQSLVEMYEAPNYQREVACRDDLPLDPFSVWADRFLRDHPLLEGLIDIDPQTAVPHEVGDRCWASVLWERSPYHLECDREENPAHVAHGVDYLIAYWLGVYYGILPGDGPYGDDDLADDDDDDMGDDDESDDDDDAAAGDDDEDGCGCRE